MSKNTEATEAYVVDNELRAGVYPDVQTLSTHRSHWAACEAMFLYNTKPREAPIDAL